MSSDLAVPLRLSFYNIDDRYLAHGSISRHLAMTIQRDELGIGVPSKLSCKASGLRRRPAESAAASTGCPDETRDPSSAAETWEEAMEYTCNMHV